MQVGPVGLKLIEEFEGLRLEAYQDPGEVWTIGYGTTSGAGVDVHEGMTCTQKQAEDWLLDYLDRAVVPAIQAAQDARQRSKGWETAFNENQVDALASLGYNVGPGVFEAAHTIGYAIRNGATKDAISRDFLLYESDDGKILAGLVSRREAERALFDRPIVR